MIRILKKNGGIRFAVNCRVLSFADQRMRFLFFFELAFDEFNDVRMIYVQNHHLGCPSRFAATLDHAREGIKSLHEADRTGSNTAARERFLAASQLRKIRAGTPFEQ